MKQEISKAGGIQGHNVVIDNGTQTIKGGFSTSDTPQCRIATVVGHGRHKGAMSSLGLKDTYVGSAAQNLRGILAISFPIRQGIVQDWDDLESVWCHIWDQELHTNPSNQPIIMTQPPTATVKEEETMTEILMEKHNVPAMFLANKSVMALYGGGQMTGVSVDSGHDTTYIVPSYQGNAIQDATLVLKIGGKQITDHLMNQLINGKYSFPDDNFMLWRKKKKTKFTVSSRKEIIQEMKEQYCTITPSFSKSQSELNYPEITVRLPDGNMIVMGKETFLAPEIMFQPSLANKKSCGLSSLIFYSVLKCDENIRGELLSNITLSGGNARFPGFEKRLFREIDDLFAESVAGNQQKYNIKVRGLVNRDLLGWVGAARLSNLSSFQRFWVSKTDYLEKGSSSLSRHSSHLVLDDQKKNGEQVSNL